VYLVVEAGKPSSAVMLKEGSGTVSEMGG
jgi:hypothetical protein